ncbi:lipopolysaccharide biosynthesis protein [Dyella jiangningensis]|uniref:lipopolysaccharide biosynthesis protein n=1 Tax=Dyella jiangningensis TaxID=1379159 RepID=UPI00240EF2A7|nr:lipopolysaccharide biosynthesis protein [Dyella jiangningensis]MDG2537166.1 lipopolysaccharide biosynthesis protein [Dyella jiangningensis]
MTGSLARNSVFTTGALALRLVTQAVALVALTRLLGPTDYGHFTSAAALAVVMGTLPSLGSGYVLLKRAAGQPSEVAHTWRYAWPLTFAIGLLLLAGYLAAGLWLSAGAIGLSLLLWMGCAELLATPFTTLISFALQATERVPLSQLVQWVPLGLRVLAVLPCFALPVEQRLSTYVELQLAASALGALTAWVIARRYVTFDWHPRLATSEEFRDGASYAAMLLVAANPTELDKVMAVRQVGATDAGIYTAGSRVLGALVMPVLAMLLTAQPRLFRHARNKKSEATTLICRLFAVALAWGLISGSLLAIASPALPLIFGHGFRRTAELVPWMACSAPFLSLRLASGSVLIALGHPLERMGFELCGIVVLLAGMLVFTPYWGVLGLIIAVIASDIAMSAIGVALVARHAREPAEPHYTA